ncbi:MAG: hypothetical protein ABIH86_04475 [Planctomycetota bacterium]
MTLKIKMSSKNKSSLTVKTASKDSLTSINKLTPKEKALYLGHVQTAASWYTNTQCTETNPWGPVRNLADEGRFVYEVYKGTSWMRGAGVWAQAQAIMNLCDLHVRLGRKGKFNSVGMAGVRYLLSLQCLDFRRKDCIGAFWEHTPMDTVSLVRDGATGCFALNYLYAHTGDKEYLERAKLFCDWYMKYGSKKADCWPYMYFDFPSGKAHSHKTGNAVGIDGETMDDDGVDGDWQAGGALAYFYTALQSGEKKYMEEAFKPAIEKLTRLLEQFGDDPTHSGWHGDSPITDGNDDFALIALMAAFRYYKDNRYLTQIKKRMPVLLSWMAEDGSYPNFGATFTIPIEYIEYLRLAKEFGFDDHVDAIKAALEKTAKFGMTLQERTMNDRFFYGGLYGQTSYGSERDRIHQRSTGYSMNFYLKYEGEYFPRSFSSYGWGLEKK